jgi:ACR3 family arsenite efflux pump ArsB
MLAALWLGLIMLMVTPCTDWYLVFTNIARGNVALGTALLPLNLLLQLLLLPLYLLLLAGTLVPLEWQVLVESVAPVLLLPLVTAVLLRRLLLRVKGRDWLEQRLLPAIQPGQILFLGLAITAMFASEGVALLESPLVFLALLPPVLLFFAINFGLVYLLARRLHIGYADYAACVVPRWPVTHRLPWSLPWSPSPNGRWWPWLWLSVHSSNCRC